MDDALTLLVSCFVYPLETARERANWRGSDEKAYLAMEICPRKTLLTDSSGDEIDTSLSAFLILSEERDEEILEKGGAERQGETKRGQRAREKDHNS